jgi:hypothetical protein
LEVQVCATPGFYTFYLQNGDKSALALNEILHTKCQGSMGHWWHSVWKTQYTKVPSRRKANAMGFRKIELCVLVYTYLEDLIKEIREFKVPFVRISSFNRKK